jgi:hypothetical protein
MMGKDPGGRRKFRYSLSKMIEQVFLPVPIYDTDFVRNYVVQKLVCYGYFIAILGKLKTPVAWSAQEFSMI